MRQYSVSLILVLAVFWLVHSGQYSPLVLSLGALSITFTAWLTHRMTVVDRESQPLYLTPRIFRYHAWLIKEIVLANIAVLKKVWRPSGITPTLKTIPISQKTDMGRAIYANSITLTPGTVAIEISDTHITVHALEAQSLEELERGDMDKRVSALEAP